MKHYDSCCARQPQKDIPKYQDPARAIPAARLHILCISRAVEQAPPHNSWYGPHDYSTSVLVILCPCSVAEDHFINGPAQPNRPEPGSQNRTRPNTHCHASPSLSSSVPAPPFIAVSSLHPCKSERPRTKHVHRPALKCFV